MRILIVHNTLNDSRSINGVMRHYVLMAKAWIAAGHPTDFAVPKVGWPQFRALAPDSQLVCTDGRFSSDRWVDRPWTYLPAYAYRLLTPHWLSLPHQYDVVIASAMFIAEFYPALILARRLKAKLVVKVHHVVTAQQARRGLLNRLLFLTERLSCRWINRHAHVLICSVPGVASDYRALEQSLGLTPREPVLSGYGIDLAEWSEPSPMPPDHDVVFLGRMHEQKGVFDLASYWQQIRKELPAARLVVVGEGPHRPRVMEQFASLGLADSARFTGGINDARKNEELRRARVGISLSREEGWGLSVTEFLAAGLPVVACHLPVFDHVFPGQLELVPPGDWRAAAVRTVELLRDEKRRARRGAAGRDFIRRYDYRTVARAELEALEPSAAGPQPGSGR
jgi:glycosyltransferase involved in cell wall biosynthesis